MTRDEVMAMNDEQLRVKAAELMGWTEIQTDGPDPYGIVPEDDEDYPCGDIPNDYPNDIAAALGLFDALVKAGKYPSVSHLPVGDGNPYQVAWNESSWVEADSAPLAITRAFILAMDGDDE